MWKAVEKRKVKVEVVVKLMTRKTYDVRRRKVRYLRCLLIHGEKSIVAATMV